MIVAYVLLKAPIIRAEQMWPPYALPAFRVAFALLLLFRAQRLRRWPRLVWPNPQRLGTVLTAWEVCAFALAIGFATPIFAALCFGFEVYVFSRSFTRSLEDVLFQNVTLFLIFVGAGTHGSVDAWLGIAALDPFDHVLARNVWWLSVGVLMFSAGFEKLFSPIWQRGLGFSYFIGLPHLVQKPFRFLRRFGRVGRVLSWVTVIAELSLLPAALLPAIERIPVILVLVGFSACLFLVVDLSFIGQVTLLVLLLFGLGDVLVVLDRVPFDAVPDPARQGPLVVGLIAFAVVVIFGVIEVPTGRALMWCQGVSRFTTGIIPNKVFTDVQLYGIYIYRIVAVRRDGTEQALVRTFVDDGSQGPLQRWHPRMFLKFTYEVTDYCLRYLRDGEASARATSHYQAVTALMHAAFDELTSTRQQADKLVLMVRSVDAVENAGKVVSFTMGDWVSILECSISNDQLDSPRQVAAPPRLQRTMRLGA